jgi:hypothetical protein
LLTASRPDVPGDAVLEWQDLRVSLIPGR